MSTISEKRVFAALPMAVRGKPVRLTGDPQGHNFVYCHGNSVYMRDIQDPTKVEIYTQHAKNTTVARYSPSRCFMASGDTSGKVKIWWTDTPEHKLKAEYPVLGGAICDIDWCPKNERLVVCGEGREKFTHVFRMETGTSMGEITGHIKSVNSCSFSPAKPPPFYVVTASEDNSVAFHEGVPFKHKTLHRVHTNFANVARISPSGTIAMSGGADGQLVRYAIPSYEIEEAIPAHKGGIYAICFNQDGSQVLTASGDKTAKIFDTASGSIVCDFKMGTNNWQDMQLGCLWQGEHIITVNGYGHIIYHDKLNPDSPLRIVKGHNKPITALAVTSDGQTAFTGGIEGTLWWNVNNGDCDLLAGKGHKNEVTDMVIDGDTLYSVGVDDTLRIASVDGRQYSDDEVTLDSQPKKVDAVNGNVVVACVQHLIVLMRNKKIAPTPIKSQAVGVSIHPGGTSVAVGFEDKKVRIYSLQSSTLTEERVLNIGKEVSCLAYSPDGNYLVVGTERPVITFAVSDYSEVTNYQKHTARIRCVAWSPDSQRYATGGLDSKVIVWDVAVARSDAVILAHTMSHANKLAWLDNNTIITVGQDSNVKQFTVSESQQVKQ